MTTITRTYPIVCPSCKGLGAIPNPMPISSSITIPCPACNGVKIVIATEVFNSEIEYETEPIKINP